MRHIEAFGALQQPLPLSDDTIHLSDRQDQETVRKTMDAGKIIHTPAEPNYIIQIQNLVGKILAQFIRIADKERVQKDEQKAKYNYSTKEWGTLQKELGDRGLNFTAIALGLMVSQFLLPEADREIMSYLAREGTSNLQNMFNTDTQAKQKQMDAIIGLAQTELNSMSNNGSTNSSSKQELISLLERLLQSVKDAARAG